jgi:hypothetical protein
MDFAAQSLTGFIRFHMIYKMNPEISCKSCWTE